MSTVITVRPMTDSDVDAVAAIYTANARDNLSPEQRRRNGFVQGRMTPEALLERVRENDAYVAEIGGEIAGVALTHPLSRFESADPGAPMTPPAHAVAAARRIGLEAPLLYGPAVVKDTFRGRGVARALTEKVFEAARGSGYRSMLAFMEEENVPSITAHERLGWQRIGDFTFQGRPYRAVSYTLDRPAH